MKNSITRAEASSIGYKGVNLPVVIVCRVGNELLENKYFPKKHNMEE